MVFQQPALCFPWFSVPIFLIGNLDMHSVVLEPIASPSFPFLQGEEVLFELEHIENLISLFQPIVG